MNFPGRASGNWSWRVTTDLINSHLASKIAEINFIYGRSSKIIEKKGKNT
jgi:4-alpha-glucanotransferase